MRPLFGLVLAGVLAACGGGAKPDGANVEIENAWIRLPAVAGRPGAAYFHIRTDVRPATLLKVSSPIALRSEMHESMKGDHGMMAMAPIQQVAIAADSSETFAPGGKHVMLFDISPKVQPGETVKLALAFAGERDPLRVDAKVVAAGDPAPAQ